MKNESQTIAYILDDTRKLTWSIYNQLNDQADVHKRFLVDGKELNSAYWIMAHLAVTENYLVLRSTGGEAVRFSWAKLFGMGVQPPKPDECPPFDEVKQVLNEVHEKSLEHIRSFSDVALDEPNKTGFVFLNEGTNRSVLIHAIRHENMHSGHLSWLCKLSGLKTI